MAYAEYRVLVFASLRGLYWLVYLKDATWVKNLCADGKLIEAIKRAEENIKKAIETGELEKQSYSYVYKVFKKE